MDPTTFAKNYGLLLTEGKNLGLEGDPLSSFITKGLESGKGSELKDLVQPLLEIRREERDPLYRKQILEDQLSFDRERMKEASKYKALFDLPGTIMSGFTLPTQILSQGASNIAAAGMRSSEQIPELLKYQNRNSYSYTPSRYFN